MSRVGWGLLALALCGCWPGSNPLPHAGVHQQLRQAVAGLGLQDSVTVVGVRLSDGKKTEQTRTLDEALLSALLRQNVGVHADVGVAGVDADKDLRWRVGQTLPRNWRTLPGPMVLAGQLREASPWAYLQLTLADVGTGSIEASTTVRVATTDVERLRQQRAARRARPGVVALPDIDLELHLVVRRDHDGFPRLVKWNERGTLEEGDRFQIRFRSGLDCEAYVFLYRSDGDRTVLFDGVAFANRWSYAPGENSWNVLSVGDEVYTIYFLAAHRVEEDKQTLWEEVDRLQNQGQIDKFRGLDLVDQSVVELLQRTSTDSVSLQRGGVGAQTGEPERFVYADGNAFDSRGILVSGASIARAYSVEVQVR